MLGNALDEGDLRSDVQLRNVPYLSLSIIFNAVPGNVSGSYTAPFLSLHFDAVGNLIYPGNDFLVFIYTRSGELKCSDKNRPLTL